MCIRILSVSVLDFLTELKLTPPQFSVSFDLQVTSDGSADSKVPSFSLPCIASGLRSWAQKFMYISSTCRSYQNDCIMYNMFRGLSHEQCVDRLLWLCVDCVEKKMSRYVFG